MKTIQLDWQELKTEFLSKNFLLNYNKSRDGYNVYVQDRSILWMSKVISGTELTDFETNYKSKGNQCIYSEDGKQYIRAESRPLDMTTYFTCAGDKIDSPQKIGGGKELKWDFSNEYDDYALPSGSSVKMKKIDFYFIDPMRIKEGAIYFQDAPKGCYLDMGVWCPEGSYYLDNNGTPNLATEDTLISHWVNKHFIVGDCSIGDELNTESASLEIPAGYKFCVGITTPNSDNTSYGHVSLELYRKRTVIL